MDDDNMLGLPRGRGVKRKRQRDGYALGKRQKLQLGGTFLVEVQEARHPPIQETEDQRGNQLALPIPNLYIGRRTLRVRHATGIFDPSTNIVTLHSMQDTDLLNDNNSYTVLSKYRNAEKACCRCFHSFW